MTFTPKSAKNNNNNDNEITSLNKITLLNEITSLSKKEPNQIKFNSQKKKSAGN